MAGINTLQEIYEKRGADWTKEFLSSNLRITEKADAYRFSFEMSRSGKLRFYGKNAEDPINRIDRTVSDLYENAISSIEKLPDAILINLPKSHRFGFNWLPESGLTLTDITIRQHGKVTKQIHEKPILEKWASLLHVKWGDELHNGKLEESKVTELMENLKSGLQPILEYTGATKTYILRGEDGIAKIAPPVQRHTKPQKSHAFDLLLLQIYEHVESLDIDRFAFHSARPDEKYIEFVCEAFNAFVNEKGQEFLEMGIKKPEFLEKSGKFNRKWIKNAKTLTILESNRSYEYLLSIFLVNLRKPKKASGLLTESFVEKYNSKINELDDFIRNSDDYDFPEFNTIIEREQEVDLKDDTGMSDRDQLRAVGMLQTYFAQPFRNTNEEETDEEEAPTHECNVLLINMGQFTNKVLQECEKMLQLTGKSFALVHEENAGNGCLWGMNQENGRLAAREIAKEHPHVFECWDIMKNPSLEKLVNGFGERKVKRIFTGRSSGSLQKEYECWTVLGGNIGEMEISQIKGNQDKEISECLEREDFSKFKTIFPDGIQKFWNSMLNEYNTKAYL